MDADRRRIVLANLSAGLLISGAAAACGAVSFAGDSTRELIAVPSLLLIVAALLVASVARRERRAKLVAVLAGAILAVGIGVVGYERFNPTVFATVDAAELPAGFRRLVPLHKPLGKPRPGEWLYSNVELGQTYSQYIEGNRVRSDDARRVIYVQPLGEFDADEREILQLTAEFLGLFYQLPVRVSDDLPLSLVPDSARSAPADDGTPRILSGYVLREVLKPRLPSDAVAVLALTSARLCRSVEGGYLIGQASLDDRVGVWSIGWRDKTAGNSASDGSETFRRTLRRVLHISAHETGHMFSIEHCIYYCCCMNGANHLRELDRQPLWLCPHCQAKLAHATNGNPTKQLTDLIAFADRHELKEEATFWRESLAALQIP